MTGDLRRLGPEREVVKVEPEKNSRDDSKGKRIRRVGREHRNLSLVLDYQTGHGTDLSMTLRKQSVLGPPCHYSLPSVKNTWDVYLTTMTTN